MTIVKRDGQEIPRLNENIIGPTIRVSPGDSFTINVINGLPVCNDERPEGATDISDTTCFSGNIDVQQFNVTNLHTHGLHVSGETP